MKIRSLILWLTDRRAWGLPIYPTSEAAGASVWMAGFFIVLVLVFLGLVQAYRMEGVIGETDDAGRLGGRGWTKRGRAAGRSLEPRGWRRSACAAWRRPGAAP